MGEAKNGPDRRLSATRPHLTSITRKSNSTNKPEADGALILLPALTISAPFYGYLKLLKLHSYLFVHSV